MIALVPPDDRRTLYAEAARVLKSGGWFSITIYPLADGFRVNHDEERERIRSVGLQEKRSGLYRKEKL